MTVENKTEGQRTMDREPTKETTYQDFLQAMAVFAGDYSIVGHPELQTRTPWEEPNEEGMYSFTQFPSDMKEAELISLLPETTDIVITCMDKNCAHSTYEKIKEECKSLFMLTIAGGVVQDGEERINAHETVAQYLGEQRSKGNMPKLVTVHTDAHDHVCGAVRHWLGESLPEALSKFTGQKITVQSEQEDIIMEALIRDGAQVWQNAFPGLEIKAELHLTDRENRDGSRLREINLRDPRRCTVSLLRTILEMKHNQTDQLIS